MADRRPLGRERLRSERGTVIVRNELFLNSGRILALQRGAEGLTFCEELLAKQVCVPEPINVVQILPAVNEV
jgi:hypothetical protein